MPANKTASIPERMSTAKYRELLAGGSLQAAPGKRQTPEEDLHLDCIEWVSLHEKRWPLLEWMVHVPNGGKRSKGEAGKLKGMGTKAGYPDLTLPKRNGLWFGLAIELKSPTGTVSSDQKRWLNTFDDDGWLVAVCRTLDEFIAVTEIYLAGKSAPALPFLWRAARH